MMLPGIDIDLIGDLCHSSCDQFGSEFYYNMEKSSIAKHKPEQKTYTVGDEIPTKSETYEYPEYFDILILRDQAAVQVRDNKIEAILPLADYRYSGVPVVNGRGFAVNVKSQKDLQAF